MQLSKSTSCLTSSSQQSLKGKAMIGLSEVGTGTPTLLCESPRPGHWQRQSQSHTVLKAQRKHTHPCCTLCVAPPAGARCIFWGLGGGRWQVPRRLLLQVRCGRTQVHPQVRERGSDELGRDGLSLQLLVGRVAVAAPEGVEVVATLGPFDPEDVDGGHAVRVLLGRRGTGQMSRALCSRVGPARRSASGQGACASWATPGAA